MRELADILIARGVLTGAHIAEAFEAQSLYGGSFDTNLLETAQLSEVQLQPFLEEAYQIRNRVDVFGVPDDDAVRLLRHAQADKYRAVPFRLSGKVLDLIVNDPKAVATIDEVAFATGCRVVVNVATEARVAWHLERSYGVDMPMRLAVLLGLNYQGAAAPAAPTSAVLTAIRSTREQRGTIPPRPPPPPSIAIGDVVPEPAPGTLADVAAPEPNATPAPERQTRPSGEYSVVRPAAAARTGRASQPPPVAPVDDLLPPVRPGRTTSPPPPFVQLPVAPMPPSEPESSAGPEATRPEDASPRPTESAHYQGRVWTGSESLEEAFSRVEHVEDIPALLFGYLGARLERMLLFSTRGTSLLAWDARGPRLRRETVETIALSLTEASVLRSACEHGMPFLGGLPFGDVEESLLVKLGGTWPQHVVLWPLRARGRTVALFYGEARSVDELRAVRDPVAHAVACTEKALERLAGSTEGA